MMLYTYSVILLIGMASIVSGLCFNVAREIFFGLSAPVMVGFLTIFFMSKYADSGATAMNKLLMRGFAMKFIFYGTYILTIFTVYSFQPIPFICSFTVSFIVLHLVETVVLKKLQEK